MTYQEFVSGPAGAAALLGPQPPRLGPDEAGRAERRPPGAGPDRPRAADHPERRRAARAGRVATGGGAARPDRRGRLPGLPGGHARSRAARSGSPSSTRASPSGTWRPRSGPTATSSSTRPTTSWSPAAMSAAGVLKPHVVFFGENVPVDRVERCYAAVDALDRQRRRAAGRRLEPDRDERPPVRAPGRQGGHPGGHRQPRRDPRRRSCDVPADLGTSEFLTALEERRSRARAQTASPGARCRGT